MLRQYLFAYAKAKVDCISQHAVHIKNNRFEHAGIVIWIVEKVKSGGRASLCCLLCGPNCYNPIMDDAIWHELQDFASKTSGDRKTQVASCLIWPDGQKVFGANHLKDDHGLTEQEIAERVRPQFYDAMKCGEADVIDKAEQLGIDLAGAKLYSLLFPCPRCAARIAKTEIKDVTARQHRVKHNGKFDNPLEDSQRIFDAAGVRYDAGKPDGR